MRFVPATRANAMTPSPTEAPMPLFHPQGYPAVEAIDRRAVDQNKALRAWKNQARALWRRRSGYHRRSRTERKTHCENRRFGNRKHRGSASWHTAAIAWPPRVQFLTAVLNGCTGRAIAEFKNLKELPGQVEAGRSWVTSFTACRAFGQLWQAQAPAGIRRLLRPRHPCSAISQRTRITGDRCPETFPRGQGKV